MPSTHKHYFISTTPAELGAAITVTALDKSTRRARVTQVNRNGDLIVDFLDTEKEERVWVATVSSLPTTAEHASALEAERKASEAKHRKPGQAPSEVEVLRGEVAELRAQIAAMKAPAAPAK